MYPIYSLEGNVHAGKTTIMNNVKCENIIRVVENRKPIFNIYTYSQISYIYQEVLRKKSVRDLSKSIILDRSFISIIIFNSFAKKILSSSFIKLVFLLAKMNYILIPDVLSLVIVPYKLTKERHIEGKKNKNTDDDLIDYSYFVYYILFFKSIIEPTEKIFKNFQHIITGNFEFKSLEKKCLLSNKAPQTIFSKICIDGLPATGKTFVLNNYFKDTIFCIDEEQNYEKYTLKNAKNQLNLISKRIQTFSQDCDMVMDTSFLTAICYLFYSKSPKVPAYKKLEWLKSIYATINPFCYITKIIYMETTITNMENYKLLDTSKKRLHFIDNVMMKPEMDNFFYKLNRELVDTLKIEDPILFVDVSKYREKNFNMLVESILYESKAVLVVDVIFALYNLVKGGKI